ncbi:hypothetical protein PR202_gb08547 [Eleusine coracana subsp. coracana]|uniref:Uncharacterized protein n=1 Tax=Eleusine coracana subsp. coracana TaxID=191504 RepID=A0AAV5EDB6_ELECO|nr:hypothetical protein PR202_gb08547 [Eleusine coracana subsp. coracana]
MAPPLTGGPQAPPRRLLQAAAVDDLGLFKRIASALDAGKGRLRETVEAVRDRGAGALHLATGRGRMKVCAYLVEELHVDVNTVDESGDTPLAYAVRGGCVETVLHTVYTPLITALNVGSLKCVELLVKAGADVKGVGTVTPLIIAANNGFTEFYKCLLEAGADPDVPDDEDPIYRMKPADIKLEGSKAYNRKDYANAVKLYSMAANHCPDDATLYSNRCLCWLKMGEGDRALMDAQICRIKRPNWAKACYLHGSALMLLKDYGKACDAFLDALELDPANGEIQKALRHSASGSGRN